MGECNNCMYCWKEDNEDFPRCHFIPLCADDIPPCEWEDYDTELEDYDTELFELYSML